MVCEPTDGELLRPSETIDVAYLQGKCVTMMLNQLIYLSCIPMVFESSHSGSSRVTFMT